MPPPEFVRAIEDVEAVGRIIEGTALTYNYAYRVTDNGRRYYLEGWRAGAFTRALRAMGNSFDLRVDHHDQRAGRVTFTDSDRSLAFTATADDTDIGNAVLGLIDSRRDTPAVSLRFRSKHQDERNGVIWRTDGEPVELSVALSSRAQYDDAVVTARRSIGATELDLLAAQARAERAAELRARTRENLARGAALL